MDDQVATYMDRALEGANLESAAFEYH
jgi:hypothetical protein